MDTETVSINKQGDNFDIVVQHDQTGSAVGITISKEAYNQLRQQLSNNWIAVADRLPKFGETVLVYCRIYGRFLATYEYIGDFQGEKYGNWRDFKGELGILPPVYWMEIPETPQP
jgi:Protein of unknown function (DUF551)